jgi:hypothetical protein
MKTFIVFLSVYLYGAPLLLLHKKMIRDFGDHLLIYLCLKFAIEFDLQQARSARNTSRTDLTRLIELSGDHRADRQ